ncbi:MAG: hypothetical protein GX606_03915 [Elusimicrobia bacterium]|nr:hypothetical protein [Elusimicrobiota bacterium]
MKKRGVIVAALIGMLAFVPSAFAYWTHIVQDNAGPYCSGSWQTHCSTGTCCGGYFGTGSNGNGWGCQNTGTEYGCDDNANAFGSGQKGYRSCGRGKTARCQPYCVVSTWSSWSACSVPCGGGTRTRTNNCGGTQSQACNTTSCCTPDTCADHPEDCSSAIPDGCVGTLDCSNYTGSTWICNGVTVMVEAFRVIGASGAEERIAATPD